MHRCLAPSLGIAVAIAAFAGCPTPAQAGMTVFCTNCSESITQLMQYAKEVEQVAETITMRIAQAEMLRNQITNMISLPQQMWTQIEGNFSATQGLFRRGQQLMLSASMVSGQLQTYRGLLGQTIDMPARYQQWSQQANDSVTATLSGLGLMRDQMAGDRSVVAAIRAQSAGADGMKQAIQANTEMAHAEVNELHRLREIMLADAEMNANAFQIAQDRQATGEALQQQFFNVQAAPMTGNKKY